ncbi:MAG: hypothetical protein ACKVY0_29715 [Prosthecobacter sp.]|uniref:hypothetical protein n=1 Tax=Prosthecobacter sp. TaxID=1965333 RepID=UPI0038FF395C
MKLNALLKTLGFLALAATPVVAGTAPAPKNPIAPCPNDDLGINASLGYDTNYVWRGFNFGQHWLSAGLDGSLLLLGGAGEDGAGTTSLNWDVKYGFLAGDQDHFVRGANPNADASFQRLELGAAFVHDFGAFSGSLGYRYYRNMGRLTQNNVGRMNDGQEVNLGITTALGPIDISSSANWDWVNGSLYFDLGASTTIAVTDAISVVPFATVGYGHNMNWQFAQDGANRAGGVTAGWNNHDVSNFTAVTAGLRFPIKLNSRATLIPYIAINAPMSGIQNLPVNGAPDNYATSVVYGGVSLNVRF